MKRSILPLLSLLVFSCFATFTMAQTGRQSAPAQANLFNHPSVEKAWETAVVTKKPLLVMFTSDHCVYCRKMLAETYGHPAIRQMLVGQAESALAHADDYGDLVKRMGIRGFPTSLLISPQGEVLDVMEGFVEPRAFAQRVKPILAKEASQGGIAAYGSAVSKQPQGP